MTLRNRLAAAAGVGVLIVVAGVSGVLYLFYADSLRARVDAALIDAAQQASAIAQQVKRSAGDKGPPNFAETGDGRQFSGGAVPGAGLCRATDRRGTARRS